ncbi:MAG: GNAT family N-acetyltransferase [Bacteroidetes bacterium]|nr:GNAT family N-acetyltransferase [Bacteroidota bacterium]
MLIIQRTNTENTSFHQLVALLDKDLQLRDGEDHSFYAQFNKTDNIKHVVIAFENDYAIGCGAIKTYDTDTMEVKRMYVLPSHRGKGVATSILKELEKWAAELSYTKCILETGEKQPEAIALYKRNGYLIIPNYGQYENIKESVCFEKNFNSANFI